MQVTYTEIMNAKQNADRCLKSILDTKYTEPIIDEIKFTKANGYWAKIDKRNKQPGHYKLIIGNLLNLIPNLSLRQKRLEETILHEMIHTLPGCFNHGSKFKWYCDCLNRRFGYSLQRATDSSKYGVEVKHDRRQIKYQVICPHCGKTYEYTRKPKYHIAMYSCGRCGYTKLKLEELA